ncbi:hypothetical protein OCC_01369 [Thermococcus litoralis DSM 5473]|uniref:Uncharacterized protein n=1 Tax=Thermococcus litoralis (strain ATCC 51850 / DSM 5473 / JCM 8560 / NS-C) TaxID=523849 RepID=H3ZLJ9_THELN|nr:hypothetical protein [Thermococcus litoralis]EHR79137.1 hypothetical protein OCC_01369 [Thermococcus litoralis DSM 5473]MDK2853390.1 hypothetical protein [Thermococcaceae archaeon]
MKYHKNLSSRANTTSQRTDSATTTQKESPKKNESSSTKAEKRKTRILYVPLDEDIYKAFGKVVREGVISAKTYSEVGNYLVIYFLELIDELGCYMERGGNVVGMLLFRDDAPDLGSVSAVVYDIIRSVAYDPDKKREFLKLVKEIRKVLVEKGYEMSDCALEEAGW